MPTKQELIDERQKCIADARAIFAKQDEEKRAALTGEEQQEVDRLFKRAEEIQTELETDERRSRLDVLTAWDEQRGHRHTQESSAPALYHQRPANMPQADLDEERRCRAFNRYLQVGDADLLTGEERRDLSSGTGSQGGFWVPKTYSSRIIKFVDDEVYLWNLATKTGLPVGDAIAIPTLESDPADTEWTSELSIGTADTSMAAGAVELKPYDIVKLVKVSKKLLRVGGFDVAGFAQSRLQYKFGIAIEKSLLTGSGAGQPLGVFTATANGIPTSRDFVGDNTSTAIKLDSTFDAYWALKDSYRMSRSCRWLFHRTVMRDLAKIKDSTGQYIYNPYVPGTVAGTLHGIPVLTSEYAPNTMTTGLYVGIIGDFRFIEAAYVEQLEFERLKELYAGSNQIGVLGRWYVDARPVLAEAFARIKLA